MVSRSLYQVEIILGTLDTINHTKLDHVTPHTSQTLSFGTIMSKHSCDERPYYTPHSFFFYKKVSLHKTNLSSSVLVKESTAFAIFPTFSSL